MEHVPAKSRLDCQECLGQGFYMQDSDPELGTYGGMVKCRACKGRGYITVLCCPICGEPLECDDTYIGTTIAGGDVVELGGEEWYCPMCGWVKED